MHEEQYSFPRKWYEQLNDLIEADALTIEQRDRLMALLLSECLDINTISDYTPEEYALAQLLMNERNDRFRLEESI